jgi:UV DNA damage repair endonuclease
MIKRIGFCCKWSEMSPKGVVAVPELNNSTTTVAWLKRQTREVAEQKLWDLMTHNIRAVQNLIERVGALDESLRMVRIGSDVLPVYTEPNFGYFYSDSTVRNFCEKAFSKIGDVARRNDVRLSFHPGQFTVLASDRPDVVERSIAEFEYHVDMIRWMGYGRRFQDFKCNVHIAGRLGHEGIRTAYKKLSPEARNTITIENEENAHGLDDCLMLRDLLPIVLDIHHFWVREGEYISPSDDRVQMVSESWRDVRPVIHYSVSREDYLDTHERDVMPNMDMLLESGRKKQKLRAHSDMMWNNAVNKWALGFWDNFDIMVECKSKNLGAYQLFEFWKQLENSV